MTRLVALIVAVAAGASFAQTTAVKPRPHERPKTQVLIFDGDDITGERDLANGVFIDSPRKVEFPRFFKVRDNFDDKLMQSVNDL